MTPILAGDKKTSQLIFLWDLCNCEAKPDSDNEAKKIISVSDNKLLWCRFKFLLK